MLLIVLLVCFIVLMLLWFLTLVAPGASQIATYSPWLAFLAVLILGVVVFLVGSGTVAVGMRAGP